MPGRAPSGRIYVVWPDSRNGDPDILLIWSGDGGTTWSAPVRVNDDAVGNKADQFFRGFTSILMGACR